MFVKPFGEGFYIDTTKYNKPQTDFLKKEGCRALLSAPFFKKGARWEQRIP